jgi:ribose/xylose/arabinose/galactoside ABC-type transport system permease subunit
VVANLFIDNAFLVVLAVGMTFVILTGGIDLSVGSMVALSTMVAASGLQHGWSAPVMMVAVLVMGTGFGLLMGAVIQFFDIQPFIVTLAGMFLARGLCFVINVESIPIKDDTFRSIATGVLELSGGVTITYSVVVALVVVAVATYVLHLTRFGRTVYGISGFCSALAGLLFSFYMLSGYSLHAVGMELDAIAAVVIGGTLLSGGVGYVFGSLVGVLVLGTIQTMISFQGTLSSWWTKIVIGLLLLAFVLVQRLILRRQR